MLGRSSALCAILAGFFIFPALSVAAGQSATDLWIISGQSNAVGRGKGPGRPPDPKVQIFNAKTRRWVTAQEPLAMLSGSRGSLGPWHAAAVRVAQAGPALRLTGSASGGKAIAFWDEGKPGWRTLSAKIRKWGKGAGVFLWYQGESDAAAGMDAETYRKKLAALVARVRALAKNPGLLTVVIQIGAWKNNRGDFMPVREAQRRFVAEDGRALLVPALGRAMRDYVHLSRDGYFELADEIARALLKTRYGQSRVNWPGPVLDAAVFGAGGNTVLAHFAEVRQLSGCEAGDFGVLDAQGPVPCVKLQTRKTSVGLIFKRALKPPARLIYGFGQHPKASLVDEAKNRAPAVQIEIARGALPPDRPTRAPNGAGSKSARGRK